MPTEYKVVPLTTGLFTGRLSARKLERALNLHSGDGWRFSKSIHERQRWLFVLGREAHFLVFERETDGTTQSQPSTLETLAKDDGGSLFFFVLLVVIAAVVVFFVAQYVR